MVCDIVLQHGKKLQHDSSALWPLFLRSDCTAVGSPFLVALLFRWKSWHTCTLLGWLTYAHHGDIRRAAALPAGQICVPCSLLCMAGFAPKAGFAPPKC